MHHFYMIEIQHLNKRYGKKSVLKDFSISIKEGSITAVLGQNGSGKSTLLSVLAGVLKQDGGNFLYNSEDLFKDSKKRNQIIAYVPQGTALIEELSAKDNLLFWWDKIKMEESLKNGFLKLLGIDEFLETKAGKLSEGMKKRLFIGCAIHSNPSVLLLDEPAASLDLLCKENIYSYLKSFKKSGGTVLLVTHDAQEIKLCDNSFIIKDGKPVEYKYDGDTLKLVKTIWN